MLAYAWIAEVGMYPSGYHYGCGANRLIWMT